jgi:8-oxo-dGTP pyrophosphatase MutT (NUDIX family)
MPDITLIAGVILRNEQYQYLLVQEQKPEVYGLWSWPAGHVDPGETLQQAAVRETKEETGFTVRLTDPEPFYKGHGDHNTDHHLHLFRGEIISGTLVFQADELLDAGWFSKAEIRQLAKQGKTRGSWVAAAMDKAEKELKR